MNRDRTQLQRLIFIDQKIRQGMKSGQLANCRSMAGEYEVSRKSILRDIDYLKHQQDAPIEYDPVRRGYFYREESYALPAIQINESDLFAICIAEKALQQHENTPVYGKLVSVFRKIEQSLPDKVSISPSWIARRVSIIRGHRTVIDPRIWETVTAGLHRNLVVEISYQKPGEPKATRRAVAPYHFSGFQGEWYMIGHCRLRQEVLTFAVSRIKAARLSEERFTVPADFDPARFSGQRFGIFKGDEVRIVRVRFSPAVAPYVREREWHPAQQLNDQPDGGLELIFPADHLLEVKQWLLSWGGDAEVLAPEELVAGMRQEVARLRAVYESKNSEKKAG